MPRKARAILLTNISLLLTPNFFPRPRSEKKGRSAPWPPWAAMPRGSSLPRVQPNQPAPAAPRVSRPFPARSDVVWRGQRLHIASRVLQARLWAAVLSQRSEGLATASPYFVHTPMNEGHRSCPVACACADCLTRFGARRQLSQHFPPYALGAASAALMRSFGDGPNCASFLRLSSSHR